MQSFKDFLREGWRREKDGTFTAEVSDMQGHHEDTGQLPRCPQCRQTVILAALKRHTDKEGDVTYWDGRHVCGARLKVWND